MSDDAQQNWWNEFDGIGRPEVERRLGAASDSWADPVNKYATAWLAVKDHEATAEALADRLAQRRIAARSAKAAETSAASAREANAFAREANEVARDANSLAATSNSLAEAANSLARRANENARYAWIAAAISTAIAILTLALKR